jgi:TetR/AcrR family transcriptional regulator
MAIAEPRRRNPEATKASILAAAERRFVAHGFAGTSMSDIARGARVTKSLIHHHFGSKEDLWNEVKKSRISHYAEVQHELMSQADTGESVLRKSVEVLFHFLRDNPEYVRLNTWMNLEDPKLSAIHYPDLVTLGVERVREEQAAGRLRNDVDPRSLIVAMVSLCTYWFAAKETGLAHLVPPGEEADDRYLDAIVKVLLEGVLGRGSRAPEGRGGS